MAYVLVTAQMLKGMMDNLTRKKPKGSLSSPMYPIIWVLPKHWFTVDSEGGLEFVSLMLGKSSKLLSQMVV